MWTLTKNSYICRKDDKTFMSRSLNFFCYCGRYIQEIPTIIQSTSTPKMLYRSWSSIISGMIHKFCGKSHSSVIVHAPLRPVQFDCIDWFAFQTCWTKPSFVNFVFLMHNRQASPVWSGSMFILFTIPSSITIEYLKKKTQHYCLIDITSISVQTL